MHFAGVFVVLALVSRSAVGQPTYDVSDLDDFYHWRDGRELLEQAATTFQRILEQQKQQQRAQGERMERLEQMLNESVEGQRRLEMQVSQLQQQQQQLDNQGNQTTRYASSQHDYLDRHQLTISSLIDNFTAKLEATSVDVNSIRDTVDDIKQTAAGENVSRSLVAELRNVATRLADAQQSMLNAHDQKRQNQSAEQLEVITGTIAVIRQDLGQIMDVMGETNMSKTQNTVLYALSDIVTNSSQKLAEIDDKFRAFHELAVRNAEFSRGQFESIIQVGNASLDELRDVAHHIGTQQQQQAEILGKIMEATNNTAPLLGQYKQIENSIGENISRVLVMLTNISHSQDRQEAISERAEERTVAIQQGQSQIEQSVARELHQQAQLLKVATVESGELVAKNLSMQLTYIEESCIMASSGYGEAMQTQTRVLSELLQLHEQATVSNVSKLFKVARAEGKKRSDDMTNAVTVAFENVTTNLREMRDRNNEAGDESFNRNLILQREIVERLNNATESQQQLVSEVGEEMKRAMNETLILAKSHAQLLEQVRDTDDAIRIQLRSVEDEVRVQSERELSRDNYNIRNITAMLAETQGTCASVASSVNTGKEMLVQGFQEQRRIVRENARLLETLNRNWATSEAQSLQQHNDIVNNITTQLVAIRDMLPQRGDPDPSTYTPRSKKKHPLILLAIS